MTKKIYASLCLDIEIHSKRRLRKAAIAQAVKEGMCAADWEEIRRGPEDDLRMLLDPGSIAGAGIQIIDSTCEIQGDLE